MNFNPYDNLAFIYDKWIKGDNSYIEVLNFYITIIKKINPNEIVELGVGTGRIASKVIEQCHKKIIGIDTSKEMIIKCKEKNINNLELIEDDILDFILIKKAEFIIMPFRTIGHFLEIEVKKRVIEQVYKNLQKDGIFIFDHYIFDKEWAIKNNNRYIKMYSEKNFTLYDKYSFCFDKQILNCQVFQNKKKIVSFDFSWIEPYQMEYILKEVGFKILNSYGDFNFNPISDKSEQQIWVVQK